MSKVCKFPIITAGKGVSSTLLTEGGQVVKNDKIMSTQFLNAPLLLLSTRKFLGKLRNSRNQVLGSNGYNIFLQFFIFMFDDLLFVFISFQLMSHSNKILLFLYNSLSTENPIKSPKICYDSITHFTVMDFELEIMQHVLTKKKISSNALHVNSRKNLSRKTASYNECFLRHPFAAVTL